MAFVHRPVFVVLNMAGVGLGPSTVLVLHRRSPQLRERLLPRRGLRLELAGTDLGATGSVHRRDCVAQSMGGVGRERNSVRVGVVIVPKGSPIQFEIGI